MARAVGLELAPGESLASQFERCKTVLSVVESLHASSTKSAAEHNDIEFPPIPYRSLLDAATNLQRGQASERRDELILVKLPKIRNAAMSRVLQTIHPASSGAEAN